MTKNILVLGAGLVGRHIATDLSSTYKVTVIDPIPQPKLFDEYSNITYKQILIHPEADHEAFETPDLVINALPW